MKTKTGNVMKHLILIVSSIVAMFPVVLVVVNSFKSRVGIFANPYSLPTKDTIDMIGYQTVFERSNFPLYYWNSIIIVAVSMFVILFFGSMVSFVFSEYDFKLKMLMTVFFLIGIIVPIRLASVSILEIMLTLGLTNTRTGLILVYCAQGLPLTILLLTQFMSEVPKSIKEAARLEGANEFQIYLMTIPMIKPAVATVGAFSIIPIWNDIWFPLILAPGEKVCTVTMGAQKFLGQFASDWNALLASLSMAMVPILILYFLFSKHILRGVVDGAVKQ